MVQLVQAGAVKLTLDGGFHATGPAQEIAEIPIADSDAAAAAAADASL